MRVASLIEQVQGLQDRRSACYQSYDDTINKYKSSKVRVTACTIFAFAVEMRNTTLENIYSGLNGRKSNEI